MYHKLDRFHQSGIFLFSILVLSFMFFVLPFNPVAAQGSVLTVTPLTWNVIGLDSNSPASGPRDFPIGARVCNTGATPLTNVAVTFTWTSANAFVDFRPGTLTTVNIPSLAAGACYDAYFEVEVVASAAAYDTTRSYVITATSGAVTGSSPQPRQLYVEHLISQNRNATLGVQYGTSLAGLTSVPVGGAMSLFVGQTYYIRLLGSTATQGYEQLESFLTLSNTIFQILGVSTTYSANTSATVPAPNPSLYANGCVWENDPNSPNYQACLGTGKAGGSVTTTYQVKILSGGGTTQTLNSLLYDFSGSSYHYNSDFSTGTRLATIINPASTTISKQFTPNSITSGGVSTLIITLGNPNAGALSGYNFVDNLPAGLTVANPPQASTSGCGTPTFAPTAGATSLTFSNGTVAGNGTCTISVKVTASTVSTYNNTTNNLFIDTIDTTKNASASLTVTTAPAPPACIPNQPMATWNFLTGSSATNPAPTTSSVTASSAAGAGLVPVISANNIAGASGSWSSDNIATGAALVLANNEYFEFTLNTTGFSSVTLNFQAERTTQGAQSIQLYYGTAAPGTASSVYSLTTQNTWFAFGPTTLNTGLNASGNTIFRLYVYNASLNNSGHAVDIDGVTFTGCGTPSNPSLTKAFAPTSIGSGGTSTLTFTLTNTNTVALTGTSFSDTLPTGMTISAAASTTCGGTLTAALGTASISLAGGTIPASSSCTVTVPVTSSTAGPATNISGFISTTETGQNNTATGSASATLTVLSPPQISKLFSPNPILTGGTSTLTFTITNPNQNNAISGVAFTDTFPVAPGAMVVATTPASTNTCGGTFAPVAGAASISLVNGTIAAGGSCTLSVNVTAPTAGTYANTSGNVSHVVNAVTFNGNTASNSLTVNAANPNISVLKQVGLSATGPWSTYVSTVTGTNVFYLITIENTGDVALSPVTVSDPNVNTAGCTWPNPLPVANATNNNHIATCVIGPVAAVAGVHPNTATASGTFAGVPHTDTATATYATAALTLDKTANPTTYTTLGQVISYSFTVTNSGSATLSGPVTINDDHSTDEACPTLTTIGDGDNFFDPNETIICTATYAITAGDITAGSVTNSAVATSGGVSSPADTATVTRILADLSLTKTVNNPAPNVGSNITFTVTVSNAGSSAATNVAVLDQLPAGYTFVSSTPSQGAYDNTTGVWTVGTINNAANATLQIIVTVNAAGPYANTAQVSASDQPDPDSTPNNNAVGEDDQATNTPTPGAAADLSLTKAVTNATPAVGSNITFTVTVSNVGPSNATGVSVLDQLPAGYTFVSSTPSQGTYDNTTGVWTVGTINNGANATLQIVVTVKAAGPYANTAQVSASNQFDPNSTPNNNNAAEDDQATNTPVPTPVADLSLTKAVTNATPNVGSNITFTLTVSNAGPSTATNVAVLDQLPAGYTFVSSTPSQGTYDNTTGVWTVGTINNAANATLQIVVTVNVAGPYANTAQVSASDQPDPDSTPNNNVAAEDDQATNTPTPIPVADLNLTKGVSNATPNVGSNITFTVTVNNAGPSNATNVTVLDQLPAGFTYVSDTPSQGAYVPGTGIWTVGALNNGASATLQIVVTVNAAGPYANTAQVSASDQFDPDSTPNNNVAAEDDQATNTPTPIAVADLSLTKGVSNATPNVGTNITFTVTVSNAGPSNATGVTVLDQLPAGYTFVSSTPSQGTYVLGTGVWTVGTINNGANATLQIVVTVNAAGPYANTAQVSASNQTDLDSIPNNNNAAEDDQATNTPVPTPVADLSLTKTVTNATPAVGSNITFTVTVSNAGPSTATNVAVLDQLPAGYTFVSSTPSQGAYDNTTGVWTVGTINNGANATLQIIVTVNAAGPYANTAQVSASDQLDVDSTPNNNVAAEDDQATNTPTPTAVADLSLTKIVDNTTPNVGTNITFTVTVSNAGPSNATNVRVLDQLPAGFTYVSDTPSQGAYVPGTGVWTVGTINNGANATLQIVVTVNAAGPYANTAQVSASDQADLDSTPNNSTIGEDDQATSAPIPNAIADLSLTKGASNPTPNVGSNITFTVTVSNAGPSAATNVAVLDQLPAGYTFVSSTPSQGAYVSGTGVWTVGTINNGASANLQIVVTVNAAGPYANTAQVSASDQPDPDSTPNNNAVEDDQATNTPNPTAVADLSVAKIVTNATPAVGSNITFTVTVSNAGPSAATNVAVLDQLPAGFTYVSDTPSQGTYVPGTGVWTVGTLNNGANATLQIVVTVNAAGPYANIAQVSASDQLDLDSTPNNNVVGEDDQATNTPVPSAVADLNLTKGVSNATPNVGTNITFTLTVSNAGPSAATNVAVLDQLPAGYTFVSSTPSQGAYVAGTGIWTVGAINSGANATLQIVVTVNATGPYANTAQVSASDQADPDSTPNNNVAGEDDQATNTPIPIAVADLSLTKVASNPTPNVGSNLTFTLTLSNAGPSAATNVVVEDQIPVGYTFVSATPSQGTYSTVTSLWTVGTINSGANLTLQIVVTVNAVGPYANTAQVNASDQSDPDSTPNNNAAGEDDQATNTPVPVAIADIFLSKAVDTPNPTVGSNIVYTVTVGNSGPSDATGVAVIDQLPVDLIFVSSNASQGAYDNTTGVWTVGAINNGANAVLQITVTVNAAGIITNSAQVSASDQGDSDSTPNNGIGNGEDDQASVSTPQGTADLSLTKVVNNATPNVGSNVTFTITVSNAGASNATNVTVRDQLTAGYTFVSATPSQGTYNSLTGSWTVGTINNAGNATLQIIATVKASGPYDNTAQVSASDQFDGDSTPNNNVAGEDDQASVTPVPVAIADLNLAKTIDNPNPNVGTNIIYTITVSNADLSDATGVEVVDLLPAGLTYVSSNPSQGTYTSATGLWVIGTINNGGSATLQITATVNVATSITNGAQVTAADQTDPDSTHNNGVGNGEDDQATISTQQGTADLSLTKVVDNAAPNVGSAVTFTITVSNAGPNNSTNATVQDQLPAGYTYVSSTATQGNYNNGTGLWTIGTINSGANVTLQIVATVNPAGPYGNTAQVSASDQFDPDSTPNNSTGGEDDQATNTPIPVEIADLALAKAVDTPNPTVGSNFNYILTLSNVGPSTATNVTVLDQLPIGVVFVASTPSQGAYDNATGIWTVGTVAANANATLHITVTLNAAGTITNSAQVTASDQKDSDSTPNNGIGNGEDDQATVSTPQGIADLNVTQTIDNAAPSVGSTVTFTITLRNDGPDVATTVTVRDQLPAGFTFVSANPGQGAYDPATGIWTVGTLPVGSSVILQITAIVNPIGPYTNIAQVGTSDQFDPDSTPNNNITGEDDQAVVLVSPNGVAVPPTPAPTNVPSAPTPVVVVVDPVVTKSVNPPFTQPGEVVTWTLVVTNPGTIPATNIVITDNMPAELQILSTSATGGNVNVNGQVVTITLAKLDPGQSATIAITTRVRRNVKTPFTIVNQATYSNAEDLNVRLAQAILISVTKLPDTGESPWWRVPLLISIIFVIGGSMLIASNLIWQRLRNRH